MSHKTPNATFVEPKLDSNTFGVKMLGIEMGNKETSKKVRVPDSSNNDDEPVKFLNPKPQRVVIPGDIRSRQIKSTSPKKKLSCGKVSTIEKFVFYACS